jgi:Big-like domain-containing protein
MAPSLVAVTKAIRNVVCRVAVVPTAAVVLLVAQMVGHAAPVPAQSELHYSKGFLLTGNFAVGGVDLTETANPIVAGFSTGTIQMGNVVPPNADIVAAYLYWETITFTSDPSQAAGVKFRGMDIDINSLTVQDTPKPLGSGAPCWSSGDPLSMHHFRADVLRLLPMQVDKDNKPTGKRLVNDADLALNQLPAHTVTLPVRAGNQIPESAGASLVVIYREDPDPGIPPTEPLRRIVIYDGVHVQGSIDEVTTLNVQGFYKRSSSPSAKLAYIGASGQPNPNERILFNNQFLPLSTDAFNVGSSSQRGWANPSYDVSSYMNLATNSTTYGETVTTTLDHQPANGGYDCLTTGAVVFSTAVDDFDNDGLPDGLEDVSGSLLGHASYSLKDPDGTELPNLRDMGAGHDQPDIFIEVNAMKALPGTSYGSATARYSPTITTKTDSAGHQHMPTPEDLKRIADVYAGRGIRVHFDVGNVTSYHNLGVLSHTDWVDDYTSPQANTYLVGNGVAANTSSLARGGETITETACLASDPDCFFPDFPGTVNWKFDFQLHRDRLVGDAGQEISLDPADPNYFDWNAGTHRRRFDRGRHGLFHYLLYAHSRGTPRSLPCLIDGNQAPYDAGNGTACTTPNPDFNPLFYHVPTTAGGIADLPGANLLVTLGLWDEFVGRPFTRAATTFHELGHNLELWHGGISPTWGNKGLNTATYIEPQCKPFHISTISYLFQVHGLFDGNDEIHIDFSGLEHVGSAEGTLSDAPLSPAAAYQPAWFAPAGSALATQLGVSAAIRFCNGKKFDSANPPAPMARVHAASTSAYIDWNGDKTQNTSLPQQDVNFDGKVTASPAKLNGFDDWSNIRLNQVGAGATGLLPWSGEDLVLQLGDIAAELAELAKELAASDPSNSAALSSVAGDLGSVVGDMGSVVADMGSIVADLGSIVADLGSVAGDLGSVAGDLGSVVGDMGSVAADLGSVAGDLGSVAGEQGSQDELSYTLANEMGKSRPYQLTVCVIGRDNGCSTAPPFNASYHRVEGHFTAPPFGGFTSYEVQRKRASASDATFVTVGTTPTNSFVDTTELADNTAYVYRVRGLATDGNSEWSRNSASLTATNLAPQAVGEGPFPVDNKATLPLSIATLLANDADSDSPSAFTGRRLIVTVQPAHGTLTLNSAGTILTYTPVKTYEGPDSFKYKTDDGLSSDSPQIPLSGLSNEVTVTITVTKK